MVKFGKWIGGGLGWAVFGPLGAFLGFALGSLFDEAQRKYAKAGMTTQGDFVMSLLVLIAAVMKIDGKVLKSELNYVKKILLQSMSEEDALKALKLLRDIIKKDIPVEKVSQQIKENMDYSSRLQLIHILYSIADADGRIDDSEVKVIHYITNRIGVTTKDERSIKSMFIDDTNAAYDILEIDKNASNDEIKKAYRKMANKYHPDKVSHLGEEFQNKAKEKFQKVNEAYNSIKKQRGL